MTILLTEGKYLCFHITPKLSDLKYGEAFFIIFLVHFVITSFNGCVFILAFKITHALIFN